MTTTSSPQKVLGFSDLQRYQACPRSLAFADKYASPVPNQAMLRGLIFRDLIFKYFNNSYQWSIRDYIPNLDMLKDDQADKVTQANDEAKQMARNYVAYLGNTTLDILATNSTLYYVDSLGDKRIKGTPDIMARHDGKLVQIELKTGEEPRPEVLDISGQSDFYALLWQHSSKLSTDYIYLDCISAKGIITRHQRKPSSSAGQYIMQSLQELASIVSVVNWHDLMMQQPHYSWQCGHCDFLNVCKAYDRGDNWQYLLDTLFIPTSSKVDRRVQQT